MKLKHLAITISGYVQGVGFRMGAKHKATGLGLVGFTQNMANGNVYIEVEGPDDKVNQFISWCKEGPLLSRVDAVLTKPGALKHYTDFSIRKNNLNLLE